jgi:transposase
MVRRELRADQWERIKGLLPGKDGDAGRHGEDNRRFVDAVLWLMRAGAPWRFLPESLGHWNSVFQRYNRWAKAGVWEKVFQTLADAPDFEYLMIDSTIVRAHQHSAGAKGGRRDGSAGARQRGDDDQNPYRRRCLG